MVALVALTLFSSAFAATPTIRPGQVLKITVARHPEFTQTVIVARDGTVEYPLLMGIPLDGLTATEVRDIIQPNLLRFEKEPEVYVIVTDVQQIKAQVYGAVLHPGKYEVESPLNLQQLLSLAGNMTPTADPSQVRIIRSASLGREEIKVDLTHHFHSDTLLITPDIFDGDMVVVPQLTTSNAVRVFGSVRLPGEVYVASGDNIFDVIQRAGGFLPTADPKRVLYYTQKNGQYSSQMFDIDHSLALGDVTGLPMMAGGDIVVVPQLEEWRTMKWWLTTMRDVAYFAATMILLIRVL